MGFSGFFVRTAGALALAGVGLVGCAGGGPTGRESELGAGPRQSSPRLVLMITVDQLRGDMPGRLAERFGEGGFRYLLERGMHYANAHYEHASTLTASGHATLATGADPSAHGIVGNAWANPETGAYVYNTEDERHHVLEREPGEHKGVSPQKLLMGTLGDALWYQSRKSSRVFSVSMKDRAAILPGGHAGKAFWFSRSEGSFVSSTYYYSRHPRWVTDWNDRRLADRHRGGSWELLHEKSSYLASGMDDRPFEMSLPPLGRTFPHPLGDGESFYRVLTATPLGDELLLEFTKSLIINELIGRGPTTDLLAISFSSTDYVGHFFGPASLEAEDNLLRLDRVLAQLFAFLNDWVGLDQTLIVLSADHGAPEAPEHKASQGVDAGRVSPALFTAGGPLVRAIERRFGEGNLMARPIAPYLYLDEDAIRERGLVLEEVERFVASEAAKLPGIARAIAGADLLNADVTDDPVLDRIRRSFHPARSGNVHLVPEPFWLLLLAPKSQVPGASSLASMHGSPWDYDTFVPIFFAGYRVPAGRVERPVAPKDIVATIAAVLGITPPRASTGAVLHEVLGEP